MTALAKNAPRHFKTKKSTVSRRVAAATIYNGAALTHSSGARTNLTAGDTFVGFADDGLDNSSAAGSRYDTIPVVEEGELQGVSVTGASGTGDIGSNVYMSDNNTFTKTSTNNSTINGKITDYDSASGTFSVSFKSSLL